MEANQLKVTKTTTRAIDLYEKAIRVLGSADPEECDLPSDEDDPD